MCFSIQYSTNILLIIFNYKIQIFSNNNIYISLIIDCYHVKIILEISNNELLFYEYFHNLDEIEHLSYFKFKYFLTRAKKKILPLT